MEGRRKVILSLVYQLMRYHTMQLLGSIADELEQARTSNRGASTDATAAAGDAKQQQEVAGNGGVVAALKVHLGEKPGSSSSSRNQRSSSSSSGSGGEGQGPPVQLSNTRSLSFGSSSSKQRRNMAVTEQDILDWANKKLKLVGEVAQQQQQLLSRSGSLNKADGRLGNRTPSGNWGVAIAMGDGATAGSSNSYFAEPAQVIKSFRDPGLSNGVTLLQLLYVCRPDVVNPKYVTAGETPEQVESNAKYALSVARKLGCSLSLVWEDIVEVQPRMLLVLLASLMYLDSRGPAAAGAASGLPCGIHTV